MKPPKNFRAEPYAYHEEVELEVVDLGNLGHGVGRDGDWVVLVPYALPGERVVARIWRNKSRYSEGDLVRVLRASAERVEPGCALFGQCGGCQYQHLDYSSQLRWKTHQIRNLLWKMTGWELAVADCIGNPEHLYGYRSKLTPHFRRPPDRADTPIGFQKAHSRAVMDIPQCPIASPAINRALARERERLRTEAGRFKKGGTLLLRDAEEGVITDMKAVAHETVCGYRFAFVAGEFFQNNPFVLPWLITYALEQAAVEGVDTLVDCYCGVGVFGICGHDRFRAVHGIEVSERAVELARANAEANGAENVQFRLGSAEALFADLEADPDRSCVLVDPPRKGCGEAFLEQLVQWLPRRVVYVSCGPDTQARDAVRLLEAGYEVAGVQPFDLFPHTRHIENVMVFQRR